MGEEKKVEEIIAADKENSIHNYCGQLQDFFIISSLTPVTSYLKPALRFPGS